MYDKLYSILEDFIKNPPTSKYARIGNASIPYDEAVDKIMKLRYEHINCAREKLKNTDLSKITSFSKYALTIIYNVAEMPEAFLKETKKEKSSFNQMKKRDYTFTAGFYTIIFGNSVIRLRESRLFPSFEDAENSSPQIVAERKRVEKMRKEQSNPWNYMN